MEALIGKLEIVYRRAMEDHHFYAAARAVELQARLAGRTAAGRLPPGPPTIEGKASPAPGPRFPLNPLPNVSRRPPGAR